MNSIYFLIFASKQLNVSEVFTIFCSGRINSAQTEPEVNSTENENESKALKVKEGNEVILLQDSLLSLTVSPPNTKSFEVQVSRRRFSLSYIFKYIVYVIYII